MSEKINLLPGELGANKQVIKLSKYLRLFSIFGVILVMLLAIGGFALLTFFANEQRSLQTQQNNLMSSIENLEAAEQGLVLIKDRVEKIDLLLSQREVEEAFAKQQSIASSLPEGAAFTSTQIESNESQLEILSTSSLAINTVFREIRDQLLSRVLLEELSLNPFRGYNISFEIF